MILLRSAKTQTKTRPSCTVTMTAFGWKHKRIWMVLIVALLSSSVFFFTFVWKNEKMVLRKVFKLDLEFVVGRSLLWVKLGGMDVDAFGDLPPEIQTKILKSFSRAFSLTKMWLVLKTNKACQVSTVKLGYTKQLGTDQICSI